jgi:hypothetical protein
MNSELALAILKNEEKMIDLMTANTATNHQLYVLQYRLHTLLINEVSQEANTTNTTNPAIVYRIETTDRTNPFSYTIPNPMSNATWIPPDLDRVPVRPTPQQVEAGTTHVDEVAPDINCAICREAVSSGTRLNSCGHHFHERCIGQWFRESPLCPLCRADIREHNNLHNATQVD